MIIGTARDLRGLLVAFHTRHSYIKFFTWLYPTQYYSKHFQILSMYNLVP